MHAPKNMFQKINNTEINNLKKLEIMPKQKHDY